MNVIPQVTAVVGLMAFFCTQSHALSLGAEDSAIPAAIRAMNFDSVFALSSIYPKSPLIIGYNRVVDLDSSHQSHAVDTTVTYRGVLFGKEGVALLPWSVFGHLDIIKSDCGRSFFSLIPYPSYDSTGERVTPGYGYLFDVMSELPLDSGDIFYRKKKRFFEIFRRDMKTGIKRTNIFDPCKGLCYDWSDPFTSKIVTTLYCDDVVRVLTRESNGKRRIHDLAKKPVIDATFDDIWYRFVGFDDPSYEMGVTTLSSDELLECRKNNWSIFVNPITGKVAPKNVLSIDFMRWWHCDGYNRDCISRMRLDGIRNRHPVMPIRRAQIRLTLSDAATNRVVYKRTHWIEINLGPDDVGSSQVFTLSEQIYVSDDITFEAEVLEYR